MKVWVAEWWVDKSGGGIIGVATTPELAKKLEVRRITVWRVETGKTRVALDTPAKTDGNRTPPLRIWARVLRTRVAELLS